MKFDLKVNKEHKKFSEKKLIHIRRMHVLQKQNFFLIKKLKLIMVICFAVMLYYAFSYFSGFRNLKVIFALPRGFVWLIKNFIPDIESLKYVPVILKSFVETCAYSISATFAAALVAFLFAVLGSETTGVNRLVKIALSAAASFLRNIPLVAWAMLLLFSFKQNNFTGFSALFIVTFGHLFRAFKELIDETSSEAFEALRALGAPYLSAIFHAVIPNTAASLISWLLYAIENNVRDAALIGILTGTGVGFLFNLYFKSFRYNAAGLIILLLVISVLFIDMVSNKIRKGLL